MAIIISATTSPQFVRQTAPNSCSLSRKWLTQLQTFLDCDFHDPQDLGSYKQDENYDGHHRHGLAAA